MQIRKQIVRCSNLFSFERYLLFACLFVCCIDAKTASRSSLSKVFPASFFFVLKLPNNKVLCTFFRKLRTLVRKSILCSFPFCSFVLSLTKMKCNPTQKFVVFSTAIVLVLFIQFALLLQIQRPKRISYTFYLQNQRKLGLKGYKDIFCYKENQCFYSIVCNSRTI